MPKIATLTLALLVAHVCSTEAQTFVPDWAKVSWEIYGWISGKPSGDPVELRPGDQKTFGIASDSIIPGTNEPGMLRTPPKNVRWSIEPSGKGVEISAEGKVSVASRATPGTYKVK